MAKFTHSTYDLLPRTASSTRWLIEDAGTIPQKLKAQLDASMPKLVGRPNLGERYSIEKIEWASKPSLESSFHNGMTTRDLTITWSCTKISGGVSFRYRLPLKLPGIPYPNNKGAYTYGADEYFVPNTLRQKNGIFPISSEMRPNSPKTREILWETPTATFVMNGDTLLVQTPSRTHPVRIPGQLWGDFARTLETYRNKTSSNINFQELPANPALIKAIQKGLGLNIQEETSYQIDRWLLQIAEASVPPSSWEMRLDTLQQQYPDLKPDLDTLRTNRQWNITAARAAERLRSPGGLPDEEFLPPNHMGRLYMETGANHILNWMTNQIEAVFHDARTHCQKLDNTSLTIQLPWSRHNWEEEMRKFFISPKMPKLINESPTPASVAIKANLLKTNFNPFGRTSGSTDNFIKDIERTLHPSCIGYVATATPESANVGVDHWPCAGARRNPITGELEKPVMLITKHPGTFDAAEEVWMNSETFEALEKSLKNENSGILIGNPDPHAKQYLLRNQLDLIAVVPPNRLKAFIPYDTKDMMPLHIPTASHVHPSRHPMAHAGISNAKPCNGSEKPIFISRENEEALAKLTNVGIALVAPADGKVTGVAANGAFHILTITTPNGDTHDCEIPQPKVNAFKNPTGTCIYAKVGDEVKEGSVIAGPEHTAYKNQIAGKEPCAIHTGVNLQGIVVSMGIEDQTIISEHVRASHRLNQPSTETIIAERQNYPVTIYQIQPGSIIRPNEVLATQIVDGKEIPIITGPTQGGILQKVTFILDEKQPTIGTPVKILPHAKKNGIQEIVAIEVQEALKDLIQLKNTMDKGYIEKMKARGIDPLECIENFSATIIGDNERPQHFTTTLAELQKPPGRAKLQDILANPNLKLTINKNASYLNETLTYAIQKIDHARNLLAQPAAMHKMPRAAKAVVFEIKTEIPFGKGSKLNDPEGTKGVTITTPYMPLIKTEHGYKPADIAFTTFAALARGSLDKFDRNGHLEKILAVNHQGELQELDAEVLPTYYMVQKANTSLNKAQGQLTRQGSNYLGINVEGTTISNESSVLSMSMIPMFLDSAASPATPRLRNIENTLSRFHAQNPEPAAEPALN